MSLLEFNHPKALYPFRTALWKTFLPLRMIICPFPKAEDGIRRRIGNLLVIDRDAALLNQAARLAVGGCQSGRLEQVEDSDSAVIQRDLCGGHMLAVGTGGKDGPGRIEGFLGVFLAVHDPGQLKGKDFLGTVELRTLQLSIASISSIGRKVSIFRHLMTS